MTLTQWMTRQKAAPSSAVPVPTATWHLTFDPRLANKAVAWTRDGAASHRYGSQCLGSGRGGADASEAGEMPALSRNGDAPQWG
jgi:hypothetical protein